MNDMERSAPPGTFRSLTVEELLAAFAEGRPSPGGGSATALAGALAGALAAMVASLSLDKPLGPDQRHDLQNVQAEASGLQNRLAELIDEDAAARGAGAHLAGDTVAMDDFPKRMLIGMCAGRHNATRSEQQRARQR